MSQPISPDVAYRLRSVADPTLSPDGSRVAYTYSWCEQDGMQSYSRVMMLDLKDGREQEFTQGNRDTAPRFAPDAKTLGFLRRDEEDRRQVWVIRTGSGEARKVTSMPLGVLDFALVARQSGS